MSSKGKANTNRVDESKDLTNTVHSANQWENADLGDDDRRQKFLKLMGASKKEHHGKLVIGESDVPACDDDSAGAGLKPLVSDSQLESQFKRGLEHRLMGGYRGHIGFGFRQDDPGEKTNEKTPEEGEESQEDRDAKQGSQDSVKESDKHEQGEKRKQDSSGGPETNSTVSQYSNLKKMKFVKSSS